MESRDRRPLLAVTIVWLVHTLGLVSILAEPTALFDARPFLDQDWGLHHTHLVGVEAFWNTNGQLWGYNPSYMAGYPGNTHLDASIKAFELAALFTPGMGITQAFKTWVFAATSAIPLLCLLAACLFAGRRRPDWPECAAALLATLAWWSGFGREMIFYGMIGWPVGCALALVVLALLHRVLESSRSFSGIHVAWLVACALLLPVHLQASIILPLPGLALLVCHPRRRDPRGWAWAAGGVGFALIANAFWLGPLFGHFADENAGRVVESLPVFVSPDPWTFVRDYLTAANYWSFRDTAIGNLFRLALLGLGVAGLVRLFNARRLPIAACLSTLVLSLFVLTYFGSLHERIQLLQPLRFKLALDLALAICTVFALERWASASLRWRALTATLALVGVTASAVGILRTESSGRMRIHSSPLPPIAALVDWLRHEAPTEGRVLFEESGDESGFVYGGIYLSSFLPTWTGLQLIGGPTNLYADRHAFAELHSGLLFGRDPRAFSDDELRRYLELYNIATLVAFHPVTIQRFARLEGLVVPERRFAGRILAFRVQRPLDWFVEGEGRVDARIGELRCEAVRADPKSGAVVLKYHWIEGLRSDPPMEIEQILLEDDPIPFIRIQDPPERFRLAVGG